MFNIKSGRVNCKLLFVVEEALSEINEMILRRNLRVPRKSGTEKLTIDQANIFRITEETLTCGHVRFNLLYIVCF